MLLDFDKEAPRAWRLMMKPTKTIMVLGVLMLVGQAPLALAEKCDDEKQVCRDKSGPNVELTRQRYGDQAAQRLQRRQSNDGGGQSDGSKGGGGGKGGGQSSGGGQSGGGGHGGGGGGGQSGGRMTVPVMPGDGDYYQKR
jgi:hypothetical protein